MTSQDIINLPVYPVSRPVPDPDFWIVVLDAKDGQLKRLAIKANE